MAQAAAVRGRGPGPAAGPEDPGESGPLRRCIATRQVLPKAEMIRFVVDPGGTLVPDLAGSLPGRGLWLRADRDIVALAARRNLFAKAARRPVAVPAGLMDQVERLLTRRCLDLLGLARRSGLAVAGFEAVQAWVSAGRAALLLAASDAGSEGQRKVRAAARCRQGREPAVVALFTGAELAAALGRDAAVAHAAVAPGRIAERLAAEARRLAGMRFGDGMQAEGFSAAEAVRRGPAGEGAAGDGVELG
ncbi:MAG: RNA-binding protein [Rhodospirillaceae bacterium]|nr:RNA-binding protein [Rhodospirillaceae bacterium]